jgi:hypothetical protein
MTKQILKMFGLCMLLLTTQFIAWGCSPLKSSPVTTESVAAHVCDGGMMNRVAELEPYAVGPFLNAAKEEGGVACWSEAIQAALLQDKPIPREQQVKALDVFNRKATSGDFHRVVGQYLHGLADDSRSYTEEDRRLLEAYSRYVIRTAYSQDDANLQLAQTACARLDRALYARLFE